MEKEFYDTYYYNPEDFNSHGVRKSDGKTLRELIKHFEYDFHNVHASEYALNLYASSKTMNLLALSCNAAPFLKYGMELYNGESFEHCKDSYINHSIDEHSRFITVYGIDSAYMDKYDNNGYPIINEGSEIYPLTLLIDDNMPNNEIKLSAFTDEDEGEFNNTGVYVPEKEYKL